MSIIATTPIAHALHLNHTRCTYRITWQAADDPYDLSSHFPSQDHVGIILHSHIDGKVMPHPRRIPTQQLPCKAFQREDVEVIFIQLLRRT